MVFHIDFDSHNLNIKLINKKNVKHCYLRILENSTLEITANKYFSKEDAINLINKKQKWIEKHLNKSSKNLKSDEHLFLGSIYKNDNDDFDYINYYKKEAPIIITPIVNRYAKIMELYPTSIKYRNNKTRWGSCSFDNKINLNINLLKFPLRTIEYVVIHELAHIKHKNHSKDFWELVYEYCEDYKECEKVLKSF